MKNNLAWLLSLLVMAALAAGQESVPQSSAPLPVLSDRMGYCSVLDHP